MVVLKRWRSIVIERLSIYDLNEEWATLLNSVKALTSSFFFCSSAPGFIFKWKPSPALSSLVVSILSGVAINAPRPC